MGKLEMFFFTVITFFPIVTFIVGLIFLIIFVVFKKCKKVSCRKFLISSIVCIGLTLLYYSFFFAIGLLGIGPVPD